jgi:hypothetical protein
LVIIFAGPSIKLCPTAVTDGVITPGVSLGILSGNESVETVQSEFWLLAAGCWLLAIIP